MSETFRKPVGWQPIETAPRDGTQVLVWDATWDEYPTVGRYNAVSRQWIVGPWALAPTHWMPLPEPPTGQPLDTP